MSIIEIQPTTGNKDKILLSVENFKNNFCKKCKFIIKMQT